MNTYVVKHRIIKILCYIFLVLLAIMCIGPVYMLLINATRSTRDILGSFSLVPGTSMDDNWRAIIASGADLFLGLRNSIIISASVTVLTVYFSLLTAYALSAYNIKIKNFYYGFIMVMVLVPGQLYIIGFFQHMNTFNLLGTFWPLIIPAIASASTTFFMKQYLDGALVPELIQAARIDGASEFTIFNFIALPLAAPGAFTFAIFTFVGSWNAFIGPLFILGSDISMHTLPLVMRRIQAGGYVPDMGAIYLSMAITLLPIIIVYLIFSRFIVSGLTLGSIKE